MHEKALCLLFWLCSKGLMVYWIIINKTYRDFRFVDYNIVSRGLWSDLVKFLSAAMFELPRTT